MNSREKIAQQFLDRIEDDSVFCDGRIFNLLSAKREPYPRQPNCGVRCECPLFRGTSSRPIRQFHPVARGDAANGCESFQLLKEWNRSQQWWVVQFEGFESVEVQARDALGAACQAWWNLRMAGVEVDKMILFDKRYRVREA